MVNQWIILFDLLLLTIYWTDVKLKETNKHWGGYVCRYWFFYFSSFIFKENHVLLKEGNLSEKLSTVVKEELDGIDDLLTILYCNVHPWGMWKS